METYGSFVEIKGSFADMNGSFVEIKGSFAESVYSVYTVRKDESFPTYK